MAPDDVRRIDHIRDSALQMKIGDDSSGAARKMIEINGLLHVVSDNSIFMVKLADHIDPGRTNESVPNTNQKVLSRGAEDVAVCRVLLTADSLFKNQYLSVEIEDSIAVDRAFCLLRHIVSMQDMAFEVMGIISNVAEKIQVEISADRSAVMPTAEDAIVRFDAFAQKAGHAVESMKTIAKIFYPDLSGKWMDDLGRKASENGPVAEFVEKFGESILFIKEIRNMLEHPREDRKIICEDFSLDADLRLSKPSVVIVENGERSCYDMCEFMGGVLNTFLETVDVFMAVLCGEHIKNEKGFPVSVVRFGEGMNGAGNLHQRYGLGITIGGQVCAIS